MVFNVTRHQVYFLFPLTSPPTCSIPSEEDSNLDQIEEESNLDQLEEMQRQRPGPGCSTGLSIWTNRHPWQSIVNVIKSNSCDSLPSLLLMIHYQVYLCPALPSLLPCSITKSTNLFHSQVSLLANTYQVHLLASWSSLLAMNMPSCRMCYIKPISNPSCSLCYLKPIMPNVLYKTHHAECAI